MKLPSRWVTIAGVLAAVASVFSSNAEWAVDLFGADLAKKLAAAGTLIGVLAAALGRALIPPSDPPTP